MVWDEAHFGKFGSHYLKREFYFDVHPPLGKMLVGLTGLLTGYDGGFDFESGKVYPDNVPYVAMRVLMATYGVALVPLGWYTAVELGMSPWACHLVALMVLCGTCIFILTWSLVVDMVHMSPQTLPGYAFRALSFLIRCCYSLPLPRSFSSQNFITNNSSESVVLWMDHSQELIHVFYRSFSFDWWMWLALTGFSIGCVTR